MYLARELTSESLPSIGRHFGGRDHTTVLHAWRRTTARIATDDASREAVEKLCSQLGHQAPLDAQITTARPASLRDFHQICPQPIHRHIPAILQPASQVHNFTAPTTSYLSLKVSS